MDDFLENADGTFRVLAETSPKLPATAQDGCARNPLVSWSCLKNYSEHFDDNFLQSKRVTYFKMIIGTVFNTEIERLFAEI